MDCLTAAVGDDRCDRAVGEPCGDDVTMSDLGRRAKCLPIDKSYGVSSLEQYVRVERLRPLGNKVYAVALSVEMRCDGMGYGG